MTEVVKGAVHKDAPQDGCWEIVPRGNYLFDHPRSVYRPVLLIPDDGSQVVVSREEWKRQCGRIEDTMKALEGYDSGDSPHATVAMIRCAILGTEE